MLAVVILSGAAQADEAAAVKLIEKLGGNILRDEEKPDKPVVEVDLYGTKTNDVDLRGCLGRFQRENAVYFCSNQGIQRQEALPGAISP
jgi:hypothetical protein